MTRRWRLLWLMLAVSVLVNAFCASWFIARDVGPGGADGHQPPGRAGQQRFARAIAHLDPEYQDQIRQKIAAEDRVVTREGDAMTGLFAQVRATLTAPRLDLARLDTLHGLIGQHDRALKDSFSLTARDIARSLPDGERMLFFQAAFSDMKDPKPAH